MPETTTAPDRAPNTVPGQPAEVVRDYAPGLQDGAHAAGVTTVGGVTHDGSHVWLATNRGMLALNPTTGEVDRALAHAADAGTAFDGRHLWQIAEARIDKLDPASGEVLASIPAPDNGECSGLAWAEGSLWVGQYRKRRIVQVNPASGEVLRTIESNRYVTGVTWVDGELWHGTWEGDESDVRRIDPASGAVQERLDMPAGMGVSGLGADDQHFYCGGGGTATVRAVRRPPRRAASTASA